MKKIEQVEQLRKEMATKISEISGISIEDIEVVVNFHNQNINSPLAVEARSSGWYQDRHEESAWYTSQVPVSGETIIFVE